MGSIILFAFPRLGLGFFFCTYKLLIDGAMKNWRKTLLNQTIQPKIQEACLYRPGGIRTLGLFSATDEQVGEKGKNAVYYI